MNEPLYITLCILLTLIVCLASFLTRWHRWQRLIRRNTTTLELIPPLTTNSSLSPVQELFGVLSGLRVSRSIVDRLLHREAVFTLEIFSTKATGIRFLSTVDGAHARSFQSAVHAHLPDVKISEVEYTNSLSSSQVVELKQSAHYAFPLAMPLGLSQHDPLSYVASAMTGLDEGEAVTLQLIIRPTKLREASLLSRKILDNEDLVSQLGNRKTAWLTKSIQMVGSILLGATEMIGETYHGSTSKTYQAKRAEEKMKVDRRLRPARTLSAFELELMESMHQKLRKPLFKVDVRIAITSPTRREARDRMRSIRTALQSYTVPMYQELKSRRSSPLGHRLTTYAYSNRLPAFNPHKSMVLSAGELAAMFHFPATPSRQPDNMATSLSRTLAAPVSLKRAEKFDVVIGQNEHHGVITPIGLTPEERERHMYIIGGTGNGKTTMLQYCVVQDMEHGKGLAVIDPHGDMAETILEHVPKDRIKDVVYFNPDDLEYPIGLNLLELTPGLSGNELLREKDLITESVISVFRKIFSDEDTGGHRIEYVLRNAIQTALTVEDATLFTVFDLLNDTKYRRSIIRTLEDKNLKNFWKNELGKAGDMQKVKMAAGITAKVGRFLFSASARQILEQPRSTIDFDDIINSGRILVCNFSKGLLGEDTSELFGITILAKLQLASLRRARLEQSERRPFYLYVDEFQNFATQSFVQMLSESRKYKLFMTMAEQSTSQQKDRQMINVILANVGTVVCFRTGNPEDERLLLPLFRPFIEDGDISSQPSFNFYARLAATDVQPPMSGNTLLLVRTKTLNNSSLIIEQSRKKYAKKQDNSAKDEMMNPKRTPLAQPMLDI